MEKKCQKYLCIARQEFDRISPYATERESLKELFIITGMMEI